MIRLKITSILLSVVMCVTMAFPSICVMADEAAEPTETQTEATEKKTETKAPEKKQEPKETEKKEEPKETVKQAPKETEKIEEPKETVKQEPKETEKKEEPKETENNEEPKATEKKEPNETEKKEEPAVTETQKPNETEKQEPTEPKREEPTEPEKEEPTESKKVDPTETERQEPTEPKQGEPTEPEESGSHEETEETTDESVTETVPDESVTKGPKNNTSSPGTISNVEIKNGILTWDSVEGATCYYVSTGVIDSDYFTNTSFNLKNAFDNSEVDPGTYWIALYAYNDEDYNEIAVWRGFYDYMSSSSSGGSENFTNVNVSEGVLTWSKIEGASCYWVVVRGFTSDPEYDPKREIETNSIKIERYIEELLAHEKIRGDGPFRIELLAWDKDGNKIANYKLWYDYKPYEYPSTLGNITNVKIENGIMTWDSLPNAEYYRLFIDNNWVVGFSECEINIYLLIYNNLGWPLEEKDSYSIVLLAYDSDDVKIGVYTTTCSYNPGDTFVVTNIKFNNGIMTWDAKGDSYYLYIGEREICRTETNTFDIKSKIDQLISDGDLEEEDDDCYCITIRAFDNEGYQTAIGDGLYHHSSSNDISEATISGIVSKTYMGIAITQTLTVTLDGTTLKENTDYTVSYSNNVNAGVAKVTVTGKGKYTGTITTNFNINPADLSYAGVNGIVSKTYTGSAITQTLTVTFNGGNLKVNTDYMVSYTDNVNVGVAKLTLTGKGNFTGSIIKTFNIDPADLSAATVNGIGNQNYTGSAITQTFTVTLNGTKLKVNTDYTVSYTDNVNAGDAQLTVTGKGNYTGTIIEKFKIYPKGLNAATITGIEDKTYPCNYPNIQTFTVTLNGTVLKENTDYTFAYTDTENAGTAHLVITGKGNYSGIIVKEFTIKPAVISQNSVSSFITMTYTGKPIYQPYTVMVNEWHLEDGTDYSTVFENNTNVGTAKVTFTGKGNYTGTVSIHFDIVPADISGATVTGVKDMSYTGSAIKQALMVTVNGTNLKENTDYSVSYTDNINPGIAKVTVTGKGNYTGTVINTFNIFPADISSATVTGIKDMPYTGQEITLPLVLTIEGNRLKQDTDYTVTYTDNIEVGKATVTFSGKGYCTGTKNVTFNIVKAANTLTVKGGKTAKVKYKKLKKKKQTVARTKMMSISSAQGKLKFKIVSVNKKKGSFKINANTGAVTVKKKLKKGTYTLKVSVTAEGNGNYNKLTKNVTFKIKVK